MNVLAEVAVVLVDSVGGEYSGCSPEVLGLNGECVQSGICMETSTRGSKIDLSMISRPDESFGRGSCWADMIYNDKTWGEEGRQIKLNYHEVIRERNTHYLPERPTNVPSVSQGALYPWFGAREASGRTLRAHSSETSHG